MAITPTIVSPGVEILEIDNSVRASTPSGTSIFVPIFAPQGPTGEVLTMSSLDDFVTTFGTPTTPAERYGYFTVSQLFQSSATIMVSRLPYGAGDGDIKSPQFTILAYPALGFAVDKTATYVAATEATRLSAKELYTEVDTDTYALIDEDTLALVQQTYYTDTEGTVLADFSNEVDIYTKNGSTYTQITSPAIISAVFATYYVVDKETTSFKALDKYTGGSAGFNGEYKDSATFLIGEPVQFNISLEEYYRFLNGQALDGAGEFKWSEDIPTEVSTTLADLGKFAFISLNIAKTNTNDSYEGFYMGLSDNAFSDPGTIYQAIRKLKTVTTLPTDTSVGITNLNYTTVPTERLDFKLSATSKGCISQVMQESLNDFDISGAQWNDTLNFGLFKIRQATNTGDALKLAAVVYEGYNASLGYDRKTTSKKSTSAVDFFVENVTKESSKNFNIYVNPYFSGAYTARGLYPDGTPKTKVRIYAQQLGNIAIDLEKENTLTLSEVMARPAGISLAAYKSIPTTYPTFKQADALYPTGLYAKADNASKIIGNVPGKLQSALSLIENEEMYNVDLLVEGGLGTIYATAQDAAHAAYNEKLVEAAKLDAEGDGSTTATDKVKNDYPYEYVPEATLFDDTRVLTGVTNLRTGKSSLTDDAEQVINNHKAVQSQFLTMACSQQEGGRGDVFFIGDTLRQISVEGKDNKIEKMFGMPLVNSYYSTTDAVKHSFSTSLYWPMRHLFGGVVSSYMAVYPYFFKVQDITTGTQVWAPTSGTVAAKMAQADANVGQWQAAAGTTYGVVQGTLDISFTTNQRQRDDMYKISLNPIIISPASGTMLWGCRTFIKKDSAFDQIPCRRTFLYIGKILRDTSKQFLFEGNTVYTRLRVESTLNPVFQRIVDARGLYSYVFICDERNNTSDVIDEGFMRMDFYGSPTRTAERILISLHAEKSGTITTEFDA